MSSASLIRIRGLRHEYRLGDGRSVTALALDELGVAAGARLAVEGPSGSGKTTLLHAIAGLLQPTEGIVEVDGVNIYELSETARDQFRARRVGYLLQSFCLLDALTAVENVLCAARFGGAFRRREQHERAKEILQRFGLAERLDHRPQQLSAGEQQRVAAARALVNRPRIVLCDEPTASLDRETARHLLDDLEHHCSDHRATLIIASHDPEVLASFPTVELRPARRAE